MKVEILIVKKKAYHRQWYLKNREKRLAQSRKYNQAHKEDVDRRRRLWVQAHPERCKAYSQKHNSTEKFKKYQKQWSAENRGKRCISSKKWRQKNPAKRAEYARLWRKQNPQSRFLTGCQSAAKRRGAVIPEKLEAAKVAIKVMRRSRCRTCYYCGNRIPKGQLEIDHVEAVSVGGKHVAENLCRSCASCNNHKHAFSLREWVPPTNQRMLPL